MQDLVNYVCLLATRAFGGNDGVFNLAGFSHQFSKVTGIKRTIDGKAVEAILWGRKDVERLPGGAHYRYLFNMNGKLPQNS